MIPSSPHRLPWAPSPTSHQKKASETLAKTAKKPAAASSARRNRDAEILEAATSVFSQKGYSAASLQEIADRVGILKGSLYHYIDSKESLLFRILENSHQEAAGIMRSVDELALSTEQKFITYIQQLVLWYMQHLDRAALYQNEWRFLDGDFGKEVRGQRRGFTAYMRQMIEDAIAEGLAPEDLDVATATRFVLSAIDSIPSWFRTGAPEHPSELAASIATLAHATVFTSREMPAG